MQVSRAAELPEDLFDHILWHACFRSWKQKILTSVGKQCFLTCAAVCRYWARLARREVFRFVALRSADDLRRFRVLLDAPALRGLEPVALLVEDLIAIVSSAGAPWLHLVFTRVLPVLKKDVVLAVNLLPAPDHTWHALSPALPRPLPGSVMPVRTLAIHNIHFLSGRVLARLLASLPRLVSLLTDNITFGTRLTSQDFLRVPYGLRLHSVTSDSLTIPLALLPRLVRNSTPKGPSARPSRVAGYFLRRDDETHLCEILGHFRTVPSDSYKLVRQYEASPNDNPASTRNHFWFNTHDLDVHGGQRYTSPPLIIVLEPYTMTSDAPTPLYVRFIHIHLEPSGGLGLTDYGARLWPAFAATAAKFKNLQCVEAITPLALLQGADGRAPHDLAPAHEAFAPLVKANKLRFRVVRPLYGPSGALETVWLASRLPPPPRRPALSDLPADVQDVFMRAILPAVLRHAGGAKAFWEPRLPEVQRILDALPEYRYHWQLWRDRRVCATLAQERVREWQSGFGAAALRGMALLAGRMADAMRAQGMDDDAVRSEMSRIVKTGLGDARAPDRRFWWWNLVFDGEPKRMFGSPLVLYTFSHHVQTVGSVRILIQPPFAPWLSPSGALILSVLAAERALQAYSTGAFVEPRAFSAANWKDGWYYNQACHRFEDISRTAHLENVIRDLHGKYWPLLVNCAVAVRAQVDRMPLRKGEGLGVLGALSLGAPWDGPFLAAGETAAK
ncbi:hypothetical protein PsYK624_152770 [Phanerochaete sordida]|uniref:Uncharacterized protein n=1 Tax=Phanerochaete sordida TaxID=48140 RepID=A0A9P3LLT8_9APHY|nr:hypothetical protein PsYK624_152770 [Phanerochaete sordida]